MYFGSFVEKNVLYESPLHGEIRAMRFGLQLAVDRGYSSLIIETYSMVAVYLVSMREIVLGLVRLIEKNLELGS